MTLTPEAPIVTPELALLLLDNMQRRDGCIEWTGPHTNGGHGMIYIPVDLRHADLGIAEFLNSENGRIYVHRLSYELANGPIPGRLVVCHKCDNPPCFNPSHLFLGTYKDNVSDSQMKGRRPVAEWQPRPAICAMCGDVFTQRRESHRYCTADCYHASTRKVAA